MKRIVFLIISFGVFFILSDVAADTESVYFSSTGTNPCSVTINQDLSFTIPNAIYDAGPSVGQTALKVNFQFFGEQKGHLLWQLSNADTSTSSVSCPIFIASDLSFNLTDAVYDPGSPTLHANFQYFGEQNDVLLWYLANLNVNDENEEDYGPDLGGDKGDGDFDPTQGISKLGPNIIDNTLRIRFVVAGDPHFNAERSWWKWRLRDDSIHPLRYVTNNINSTCNYFNQLDGSNCQGVVMVGDLSRGDYYNHSLLFYRSLYEHDKTLTKDPYGQDCWDNNMPSNDQKIKYPVYPMIGNHDDSTEDSSADNYDFYVRSRMHDSANLFWGLDDNGNAISNYLMSAGGDMYAWEWGSFHFIAMGSWAFYGGYNRGDCENRTKVNWAKVNWLVDHLKAIGKEKPIILFQHYGWDDQSLNQAPKNCSGRPLWWSRRNVELLGDVLCDNPIEVDSGDSCTDPYNILGIFTGHLHDFAYSENVCGRWVNPDQLDSDDCIYRLPFDNYVVDDAGHDTDKAGVFHVLLTADENGHGTMNVNQIIYSSWDKHKHSYDRDVVEPWKTKTFNVPFLRFASGEPNNVGGVEDCAILKANGRYFDVVCDRVEPFLCSDSHTGELFVTDEQGGWSDGFAACRTQGGQFDEISNIGEQYQMIQLLHERGISEVWVNYTDKLQENNWGKAPWFLEFFDHSEPSNGDDLFEKGWGENCALLNPDNQWLYDVDCDQRKSNFACKDLGSWKIVAGEGAWADGYSECGANGFVFPDDRNDYQNLLDAVESAKQNDPQLTDIWVGFSDLDEEGQWTDEKPWIVQSAGWAAQEPNNGNGAGEEDCALKGYDGFWYDVPCENYHNNPFACRSYETGLWKISEMKSSNWIDGFEACRQMGLRYHFAAPIRKGDNDTLRELYKYGEVWINYTDAPDRSGRDLEGFWRQGIWINWGAGEPNNAGGAEDCAAIHQTYTGGWILQDISCDERHMVLCRRDSGYYAGHFLNYAFADSWWEASEACKAHYENSKFTYPYCPSEYEQLLDPHFGLLFYIRLNDSDSEGYWVGSK